MIVKKCSGLIRMIEAKFSNSKKSVNFSDLYVRSCRLISSMKKGMLSYCGGTSLARDAVN